MKSATGLTGSGVRDWVVQRLTAVILAIYMVVILGWFLCCADQISYQVWRDFMLSLPMKILGLLAILSLVGHAWVGMWTVFTDYITSNKLGAGANGLRLVLQSLMIIALLIYAIWGIAIFWAI